MYMWINYIYVTVTIKSNVFRLEWFYVTSILNKLVGLRYNYSTRYSPIMRLICEWVSDVTDHKLYII